MDIYMKLKDKRTFLLGGAFLLFLLLFAMMSSVAAADNMTVGNVTTNNMSFVVNSTTVDVNSTTVDNLTTDDVNSTAIVATEEGEVLGLPKELAEGVKGGALSGATIGAAAGAYLGGPVGALGGAVSGAVIGGVVGLFIATIKEIYKIYNSTTVGNLTTDNVNSTVVGNLTTNNESQKHSINEWKPINEWIIGKFPGLYLLLENIVDNSPSGIIKGYVFRTGLCIKNIVFGWKKSKNKYELISSNIAQISLIVGPLWKHAQNRMDEKRLGKNHTLAPGDIYLSDLWDNFKRSMQNDLKDLRDIWNKYVRPWLDKPSEPRTKNPYVPWL